jgi:hypothetical protein
MVLMLAQMFDIEHGLLHDLECSVGPNGQTGAEKQ